MNPHSPEQQINFQEWHHCYREASGEVVVLNFLRESMWQDFIRYMAKDRPDFTMADLRAVIALRKRRKKHNAKGHHSVAFNALIGSPDLVEEEISEARAISRQSKPSNRDRILSAAGIPEQPKDNCRPIKEVFSDKALADLKLWRLENGL